MEGQIEIKIYTYINEDGEEVVDTEKTRIEGMKVIQSWADLINNNYNQN